MNSLSWFLYFAGVAGGLSTLLITVGLASALGWCGLCLFSAELNKNLPKPAWLILPVVLWTVAAFIPNKDTLYAIAASELGEKLVTSDLGSKAQQALSAWIESQIPKPAK
jgi:hypothetical protein